VAAVALTIALAQAYVPWRGSSGIAYSRPDFANVQFYVSDKIAAGLRNSDGTVIITEDSDPLSALQAAANTWSNVAGSAVRFAPVQRASIGRDSRDLRSAFVFADTPELQSVVGSAVAVTALSARGDGPILDADILFNGSLTRGGTHAPFSTTMARGSFDLQAVATHELGHALGSRHSGLIGATMYYLAEIESDSARRLTADDVAFLTETYPAPGARAELGAIGGRVVFNDGRAARSASVVAVDRSSGVMLQALTDAQGSYRIGSVPPGEYEIYAEPLDGPIEPDQFGLNESQADIDFMTSFAGAVTVSARATAGVDVIVAQGRPPFDVEVVALRTAGAVAGDAVRVPPGRTVDILLFGRNLDASGTEIRALGRGLNVRPSSVRNDPSIRLAGYPAPLRFTLDVGADAEGLGAIVVQRDTGTVAWSGGLVVTPRPSYAGAGVVNAASFMPGPIAPGELVSIFGSALGPPTPVALTNLDPATNRVPVSLGGVAVTFDGIAAPLLYVSSSQINVQVPFELSGRNVSTMVVSHGSVAGQSVQVAVAEQDPGIFVTANQDGSINSVASPAPRGSAIVVYATGQGVVSPPIGTGELAPTDPLRSAPNVTATLGGVNAPVLFGGLAPHFAGLMQVNVLVPENAPAGANVPLRIFVNGASSQTGVTVAVR
jgi:uncharacterized protein (TIGR03437 family)